MTRPAADRVKVEWTGVSTGTMTLGAAVDGFQAVPSSLNGQIVSYLIEHQTSTEAEAGFGTYTSSGTTLSRTYRTYPTLGGSAVNFSAGVKHVRVVPTHLDVVENRATSNPGVNDDIGAGYIAGRSRWLNTSTNTLYFCVSHAAGAAVWIALGAGGGTVTSVNGDAGPTVTLTANEINIASLTPSNYTPANSSIEGHLSGVDTKFATIAAGSDAVPTQVVSNVTTFALTNAMRLHNNVEVRSHAANVDFEIAASAAAGSKWLIKALHDGCTVSITGDVGTLSPDPARLVNGGTVIVEVDSNPGSPASTPVAYIRGNVIVPGTQVGGTKTYDNDDSGQDFDLTTGAGDQTFPAVAGLRQGWYVNVFNSSGGNVSLIGADRTVVLPEFGAVLVRKHKSNKLLLVGTPGTQSLDDA